MYTHKDTHICKHIKDIYIYMVQPRAIRVGGAVVASAG